MKSLVKPLLAFVALMTAFYLSVSYHYGDPGWQLEFRAGEAAGRAEGGRAEGGRLAGASGGAAGASAGEGAQYDLKSLPILNRVVIQVKENYVDPSRVNERQMLGAAMEEVQRAVAELLVEVERDEEKVPTRLTVRVGDQSQTFDLKDVGNLWQMSFKFKDIFRFVQGALPRHEALRDIEYAAINGMLSTLDPHSVLLRPEDYREMKLSTRGKFGGLGIVISIRDGHLTVVNPIEDTPATRAGIKAGDRIVQIGLDSTVNMALSDAVDLMRGEPGTPIDIWVLREGWEKARKFRLERADIKVKSVASERLPGRVGLIKLRNFQHTTADELDEALGKLEKKGGKLKGLVLDLRGNPGGLLDQAIKISDRFIESGALVTTVGYGDKVREPKMATRTGTLTDLPLVVLIDGSSASASEIVAGALKNHQRALLIGQQTFGKGSVQVIYDNKDDSALKLTIAQYLTPGDLSIQSVGVPPDIETQPVVLTDDETDFFRSRESHRGEADLPAHLDHASAKAALAEKPLRTLRYLKDAAKAKDGSKDGAKDEPADEDEDRLTSDFEIELARTILLAGGANNRAELLSRASKALAETEAAQQIAIEAALKARGVDWSPPVVAAGGPAPTAEVTLTTEGPHQPALAGDTVKVVATVRNTGAVPFARLRATTKSENEWFDGYELLFGNIPPGESRSWSVNVKLPKSALTRRDEVKLQFAGEGPVPELAALKVAVEQLPRPRFALHWRVDDRATGNGDGLLQAGEEAEIVVTAQNVGTGPGYGLVGTLRDEAGEGVRGLFIRRGRVRSEAALAPGEQTEMRFGFTVKTDAKTAVPVVLSVMDTEIREATSEKLSLQVVPANRAVQTAAALIAPRLDARMLLRGLYRAPDDPAVATASLAQADALVDGWYRVPTGDGLFAWVAAEEVLVREPGAGVPNLVAVPPKGPPVIQLAERAGDPETGDEALTLSGEVLSEKVIKDLLIFVNNKKVFFKANSGGPLERLRFSARVPLEKGVNRITLVARQDEEATGRHTLIINRSGQ